MSPLKQLISSIFMMFPQIQIICSSDESRQLQDYAFFGIYILELVLRFCAFGPRVVKSNWVKFDMFLVASATADLILKAKLGGTDSCQTDEYP